MQWMQWSMRHSAVVCGIGAVLLLGGTAWGAPRKAPGKAGAANLAPVTEVSITDVTEGGGRDGGLVSSVKLRSNGTVQREGNEEMPGAVPGFYSVSTQGTFKVTDFPFLVAYLTSARVLDLKVPRTGEYEAYTSIAVVRGGKTREIKVPASAPYSPAKQALWVVENLVKGITAGTRWKDPQGHLIDTGIEGYFDMPSGTALAKEAEEAYRFTSFDVLDARGKKVAGLQISDETAAFRALLPPGSYKIVWSGANANLPASGYAWRATPSQVSVRDGSLTPVIMKFGKEPATP